MFEHSDREMISRLHARLELVELHLASRFDTLMATSQNVLDAAQNTAQNTAQAVQNLVPAVQALSDRLATQPYGILTEAEGDQLIATFQNIGTAVQQAVDLVNTLAPTA